MTYYAIKIAATTIFIVIISEISKRQSFAAAILASLPLISIIAMTWLYIETKDVTKVSALSMSVFWLVLPSLVLFVVLPTLLKQGVNFYLSMGISMLITAICYLLMVTILNIINVKL